MRMSATDLPPAWKVSLHGGHSGEFCDHAEGPLRAMLEAAAAAGYHTFGVSEHMPRPEARFLYRKERELGWDLAKIEADFARYTEAITPLAEEFADRLIVLRGFETEVLPKGNYAQRVRAVRETKRSDGTPAFDYCVGSVHFVEEIAIDGEPEDFAQALEVCGDLETLAVRYYDLVAEMIAATQPEVVGHFDVIKKNTILGGYNRAALETPRVQAVAERALEAARAYGAILDLNTAGWRKRLGEPYPGPALVRRAQTMGVPFCFGDDSHRPADVGAGVEDARRYLLENGVTRVTVLTRETPAPNSPVVKRIVSL